MVLPALVNTTNPSMFLSLTISLALFGTFVTAKADSSSRDAGLVEYQVWLPKVPFHRASDVCKANGLKLARFVPKLSPYLLTAMREADVEDLWTASPSPINKATLIRHPDPNSRTFWTAFFSKNSQFLYKRAAVLCKVSKGENIRKHRTKAREHTRNASHKSTIPMPRQLSERKKQSIKASRKISEANRQKSKAPKIRVRINGTALKGKALSQFLQKLAK